jgi:hypothetical protein
MEFRLIYEGRLPAQSGSNAHLAEKHSIRKEIHKQLKALWYSQASLLGFASVHRKIVELELVIYI